MNLLDWKVGQKEIKKCRVTDNTLLFPHYKVQVFWESHKNLAHFPLFIWHYLVASNHKWKMGQIFVAFSEYLNFKKLKKTRQKMGQNVPWSDPIWSENLESLFELMTMTIYHWDLRMSKQILVDPIWSYLILSNPIWSKNLDLLFEIVSAGDHWGLRMSKQILSDPFWSFLILSDPKIWNHSLSLWLLATIGSEDV